MTFSLTRAVSAAISIVAFVGLLTSFAQNKDAPAPSRLPLYKYDTPGTSLDGVLTERKVYGAPGYGEMPRKDSRLTILVLKLVREISVEPDERAETKNSPNLDPAKNVRELQLFVKRSELPEARKLIGREVIVTGTLNESLTASQYTKVWIDVERLVTK